MLNKGQTGSKCTLGEYELYNYIKEMTQQNGGVSVNAKRESPTKGYMVGIKSFETLEEMLNYKLNENEYYGGWLELNDKIYYDVSLNVMKLEEAEQIARKRDEIAIYNVVDDNTIIL